MKLKLSAAIPTAGTKGEGGAPSAASSARAGSQAPPAGVGRCRVLYFRWERVGAVCWGLLLLVGLLRGFRGRVGAAAFRSRSEVRQEEAVRPKPGGR